MVSKKYFLSSGHHFRQSDTPDVQSGHHFGLGELRTRHPVTILDLGNSGRVIRSPFWISGTPDVLSGHRFRLGELRTRHPATILNIRSSRQTFINYFFSLPMASSLRSFVRRHLPRLLLQKIRLLHRRRHRGPVRDR